MSLWLLKTKPGTYSWADLVRNCKTVWEGITSAGAHSFAAMKKGDHGVDLSHWKRARPSWESLKLPRGLMLIQRPAIQRLSSSISSRLRWRAGEGYDRSSPIAPSPARDLLRIGRLSVVPVPKKMWDRMLKLSGE